MMGRAATDSFNFLMAGALLVIGVIALAWFLPARETSAPAPVLVTPAATDETPQQASRQVEVERLLEKGRLALDAEIYVGLDGASAEWFFTEAQRLDPGNAEAADGYDAVIAGLALLADEALQETRYNDAIDWLERARELSRGHDAVDAVASRIAAEQRNLIADADVAAAAGEFGRATRLLLLVRDLGPDTDDGVIASFESRFAAIRAERADAERLQAELADRETAAEAARADREAISRQVDTLIGQARSRIEEGALLIPNQDSALWYLHQAAILDPDNGAVAAGFEAVVLELIASVRMSLDALDVESAGRILDDAELAGMRDDRITALRKDVRAVEITRESQRRIPFGQMRLLEYVQPTYSSRLAARQVEGWVDVEFTVLRSGETSDIVVIDSSHENFFVDSTTEAVAAWRFEPRRFRGQEIDQRVGGRIRFALD